MASDLRKKKIENAGEQSAEEGSILGFKKPKEREDIFVYTQNNLIICTLQRIYIAGRLNNERLNEQICKKPG